MTSACHKPRKLGRGLFVIWAESSYCITWLFFLKIKCHISLNLRVFIYWFLKDCQLSFQPHGQHCRKEQKTALQSILAPICIAEYIEVSHTVVFLLKLFISTAIHIHTFNSHLSSSKAVIWLLTCYTLHKCWWLTINQNHTTNIVVVVVFRNHWTWVFFFAHYTIEAAATWRSVIAKSE